MDIKRRLALALFSAALAAAAAQAAELPSQSSSAKKPKAAQEPAKTCNIAGVTGVMLANGVCER